MTAACPHPHEFRASDGFGGVRCMSCFAWLVRRPSVPLRVFRWLRGGAR